jgi:hypothetical protein
MHLQHASLFHLLIYLDFLYCQSMSPFSRQLTSQEPLGFSRLGIPILLESYYPNQDTDHEDYPSAQSLIR